ncbi:hypothetical protein BjapCC829_26680 [Bradyrhizobium barranii]|uniref:Helix-turn-helix protein n=2 Tax=Bradyrhizobium TaxID=374 RepID=A0ABY3QC93_9BRAD|nr:hypothetical protein [Bradyrhizobium japonicum]UFW83541.1 hypothetical protein BjapCC829_26680 [Bradyrhizobium japonicum]
MAQLVDYDLRLTDPARTVYRFMIGWYMHAKHGDALASVRHIVKTMRGRAPDGARHLSRSAVQRAIVLLIECGWLVRTYTGKGRGGSRYVPVLNVLELAAQGTLPLSVPDHRDATEISLASHSTGTVVSHSTGTQSEIASQITGTKTLLLDPATDGSTEREIDPAAPTAPPLADGLAATAAGGTAVDERTGTPADTRPTFEALWRAYAHAKGKKEAKAAWDALPAEVDRPAVIQAAAAWKASWAAQGKPNAPRYTLARWLKDERYDEDAPRGFQKAERSKAKSNATKPAKPRQPAPPITARVTSSALVEVGSGSELHFTATDEAGIQHQHVITLEHPDAETQFAGQKQLAKLVHAAGLETISDSGELHGRTIVITGDGFEAPATRPDDETPLPVKPEPEPLPAPESKPLTEAEEAAIKARIEAIAPRREPTEWERRREAGRREWDAAHPEFFEDAPVDDSPSPKRRMTVDEEQAEYDAWFEAQLEDGA